jgi:hypothetical protein
VRGIETTVRALVRARVRHFVVGVGCGLLAVLAFNVHNRLTERMHDPRVRSVDSSGVASRVADVLPVTQGSTSITEWTMLVAGALAWYHLREWRGKGRRYRNQRRRAANELLRADFQRCGHFKSRRPLRNRAMFDSDASWRRPPSSFGASG